MVTARSHNKSKAARQANGSQSNGAKANGSRTRASNQVQRQPSVYASAMDNLLPQNEVIRLSVVECLRELTGQRLQSQFRVEGREFDWNAFNEQFRNDYSDLPMKQLMAYARSKFGIESLEEIRERRERQKAVRNGRIKALGGYLQPAEATNDTQYDYIDLEEEEYLD